MKWSKGQVLTLLTVTGVAATLALLIVNLSPPERKIERRIRPLYTVGDPQFLRSMGTLLGPPIVDANHVEALQNGDQIFPAMLEAIRGAEHTIAFETYIYWSGNIGKRFADAFSERARAGVDVHVLLDWVGSGKMDEKLLNEMSRAGVTIRKYHPLHWYHLTRMNNRTHRKILVVDGRIGFTGGVGIADIWSGHAQDRDHWRDSHFRIEGPAVGQMQSAFMDNWMETEGEVLHDGRYFPEIPRRGEALAQVFSSSPGQGSESVRLMYLLSIACAGQSIRIAASYFVPDDLSVASLVAARKRNVAVEIIVPGPIIDAKIVRKASRARWGDLLRAGVSIYEYQPTMFHSKVMAVDDLWVSVGSTNFDDRSFRLNDETNLNVLDRDFALKVTAAFEDDKAHARRITLEEWERRPWTEKLTERAAALFRSQL